ncbi:MAG TPA: ATP-binding protein [Gammaproteobacteria bacterium]|nr:ATP-binding protein [Gammaproteobacteria bacterium]
MAPTNPAPQNLPRALLRQENLLLAGMLLLLHVASQWDFGSALSTSLMIAHLGLFLLWQPLWQRESHLSGQEGVLFLLSTVAFIGTLNWWSLAGWQILLIGLVGGRPLASRGDRVVYMLALFMLVCDLLIGTVPNLFYVSGLSKALLKMFRYGLLAIPLLIPFVRLAHTVHARPQLIDLFRAVTAALMTALVAVSSLLTVYHTAGNYLTALLQALLVLAAFLLLISWLLTPHAGPGGLLQLWERSLLNIGTPFEDWLIDLAALAHREPTPAQFLDAGLRALTKLPWCVGVTWRQNSAAAPATHGRASRHYTDLHVDDWHVRLYLRQSPSVTLLLHIKLLVSVLEVFYDAKTREQTLSQQAHIQAVYETGARVTHDIKNLLQSLRTMTMALAGAEHDPATRERGQQLLEKQLPIITQRLQLALDKLQAPEKSGSETRPLREWWEGFKARNQHMPVIFRERIPSDDNPSVPSELFDSVAQNLLENAYNKKRLEPELRVTAQLTVKAHGIALEVGDNGSAIPATKAQQLFSQAVSSSDGLGIGLYQASKLAESLGYRLRLCRNVTGDVCFALETANEPPATARPEAVLHQAT